uniref:Des-Arg1-[Thr6]-phyllokinin n=1 Tax=Physalaemus signifer TaxID=364768 RepID=BRK9_PHYSG|nr:RecName: Full=Des-Arg1-[Thr6]-phyllokinin; Short=Des-Arg-[Thr6]-phyllokinin [Physalaemus signifer]
PPGFTPFRIY